MNKDLYLHESILLLSLDDQKGNFTTSISYLNYGFAAALIMDLVLDGRISIEDSMIKLKTNAITENKLLNDILRTIQNAKKPKKISNWLHTLVASNNKFIKKAIGNLIKKGILIKTTKKFLWIFNVSRYPTINVQSENKMRERLQQIIFEDLEPEQKEIILLTIVQSCKMLKDLISDKEERKVAKSKIIELTEDSEIRKLIGNTIEEMETIATMVTTTAI